MYTNRFEFSHYSVLDTLQELVYEGRRKPFFFQISNSFRLISETKGIMSTSGDQNQKSHTAVEKASSSNGKENWRTYSAHFFADQLTGDLAYCDVLA